MLGTLVDAYFRGYDCIVLEDATATMSPEGGYSNTIYNAGNVSQDNSTIISSRLIFNTELWFRDRHREGSSCCAAVSL